MSRCECGRPEGQCTKGDLDFCDADDPIDPDEEEEMRLHMTCGRWDNGKLGRYCSLAGTEQCDWDCPYAR